MAKILPETLPQNIPGVILKTFRSLKSLPDTYLIWHSLAPWQINMPDFLVITFEGHVLLIKVSPATSSETTQAAQMLLLEDIRAELGLQENEMLASFLQKLELPAGTPIETLVVFPNIAHKQVMESRLSRNEGEPQWAGRELLSGDNGVAWKDYLPQSSMDGVLIERVRQLFSPEILVSSHLTVRPENKRRLEAGLTSYLLDYSQEQALKSDLDIEPEGQSLTRDFKLYIVNGVAGSGKTLILLFRLRLLSGYYPSKKFLVLTHNRPLSHDMQSRFVRLTGGLPENIEWGTFNQWCNHHWPSDLPWVDPINIQKRERLLARIWEECLVNTSITQRMLTTEIDWLKDQIPMSQEEYLKADRRGRGFGLTTEQRQLMWKAALAYQQALKNMNTLDWGDIPRLLWKHVVERDYQLPRYDFIMIDEAQFFAPIWISLLQKSMNPTNAHLFVVADPTQGFLGRKGTWKSLGLDARGHSYILKRSYRTTREIMQFATMFYRMRMPNEPDDDILMPDLFNMPKGVFPQMIVLGSSQDEIARVANEVADFLHHGCDRKQLLLLHANGPGANQLIQAINARVGNNIAMDPKQTYPGDYVRVTTLNAGAGLESAIVFLVGLRELFEEEQSLRLSDEERETLIASNTKKIYMAVTRAGQRLVFTYVGELPEVMKKLFQN